MAAAAELEAGRGLTSRSVQLPDGRHLRVVEAGTAGPLVLFEAGGGACASEWVAVQRLVAQTTRTLAYDRAGYAGSDEDPRGRTVQTMAADIGSLLDAVGEAEPVILVAHSWGGAIVRCFARTQPSRVAGLAFVDATVSDLMTRRDAKLASGMAALQAAIVRLRLPNPLTGMLASTFGPDFPEEDRALMIRDFADRRSAVTFRREAQEIAAALPVLKEWEEAGLPAVPVTSIVGGTPAKRQEQLREALIAHERREMERHGGVLVVVDGAGHYVPQQRPTEAAQAVIDLVDLVRSGTATRP
jgi:pimeloyl-ACP methyl ester carboxylesterase